jgi:segregation and condensation protein B
MPSKLDELVFQVEAVLFASGKPLSVKEVTDALGIEDYRSVQKAVRTLEQTYENRQSALEVRRVGDRFALQLKEEYVPSVHAVTPLEMGARSVKALTLIAYHQPILQSHLVRMLGDVAYEEVQHLRGMGLVHTEASGSTLELTTTRRFAEYFGIPSSRPEEIRRYLEGKLGVVPSAVLAPPAPTSGADADDLSPEDLLPGAVPPAVLTPPEPTPMPDSEDPPPAAPLPSGIPAGAALDSPPPAEEEPPTP